MHLATVENPSIELPDGLTALRKQLDAADIMRLIERTARWVHPDTFRMLPVWYPEYARRTHVYKANWSEPQMNVNRETKQAEHKREGNRYANQALTNALGLRSNDRPNWSCCHIWGVDDPLYQQTNAVVQDRRFYSWSLTVLLPTPLKAFTDTMADVKAMLRICARFLYSWHCDHDSMKQNIATIETWADWSAYPDSWPTAQRFALPLGVVGTNDRIRESIGRRRDQICSDLQHAGRHYPREDVRRALAYWKLDWA